MPSTLTTAGALEVDGNMSVHADSWLSTPSLTVGGLVSVDTAGELFATTLTLTGVYRPPLGSVGAGLDQAILHRVATATIRDFLARVGAAITMSEATTRPR